MMSSDEQLERSKSSKPLMEKRRRARINDSLLQLKNLVLDALNKNNPRDSKLEKADILEMTVRYLRSIHRQQLSGMVPHDERANIAQYQTGYAQCMHEVSRYLNATSNASNESNRAIVLHNLTTKEATERQIQASLLNHLVTQSINTRSGEGSSRERKSAPIISLNRFSKNVPTMQLYTPSKEPHSVKSSLDVAPSSLVEETASGGPSNPSSSVFSGVGSVATVDPMACPSISPTGAMTGEEIRLVVPQNLVYSGQIATHVIPIYAASPSVIPQAPPQPALSSSSLPVMLTPTSAPGNHGNGNASTSLGDAVASVSGRFAFIPTISTSSTISATNPIHDSSTTPKRDETVLGDFKYREISPPLTPTSLSYPIPMLSSASPINCNIIATTPLLTPTTRTTTIKEPSQSYPYPVHTTLVTKNPTNDTKTHPNQTTFSSAAPIKRTVSSTMPTSASISTSSPIPILPHHSNTNIASPSYQTPITSGSSTASFVTPGSSSSYVPKFQHPSLDPPTTEHSNMNPPEHLPGMMSNRAIFTISVNKPDVGSKPTHPRSPYRTSRPTKSKRIRSVPSVDAGPTQDHRNRSSPAPPVVARPPQPPGSWSIPDQSLGPGSPHSHHVNPNRNEMRDVNDLGIGREITWRPW